MREFDDFMEIVRKIRRNCPWDSVQTHESLKKYLLEESNEVLEGIDRLSKENDSTNLCEELGDVLLQVVFHTVLEEEQKNFVLDDVISDICRKLIVRHPHVFGDVQADTVDKVLSNWDSIKKETKGQQTYAETLESVPKNFPALMRAEKLTKRADRAGVDFTQDEEICSQIKATLDECRNVQGEDGSAMFGKLLMLITDYARHKDIDCETALADYCSSFTKRFAEIEKGNDNLSKVNADELYS